MLRLSQLFLVLMLASAISLAESYRLVSNDHLEPQNSIANYALDDEAMDYRILVGRVLASRPGRATMIVIPSFEKEWAVAIHGDDEQCVVSSTESKVFLFDTEHLPADPVYVQESPVELAVCNRIAQVWVDLLIGTRPQDPNPDGTFTGQVDGTTYHFQSGLFAGKTHNRSPDTRPHKLVQLGYAMAEYAKDPVHANLIMLLSALEAVEKH